MEAAKLLCDSLFRWLENREDCAEELKKLAQELKDVHQGSNIAQVVGADTSVASISGEVFTSVFTGGLASPRLISAAAGSLAGTAVSVTSTLVETGVSSSTFKKATELIKEDEKVGTSIQKLLRDLKDGCAETQKARCGEAPLGTHADELDCEMATLLMWALARRSNTPVPLDFLRDFNRATFFRHMTPGGLDPAEASRLIFHALGLAYFDQIKQSLKLVEEMAKNIRCIGIKASAKAGSKVQGATGLGISLYDLIVKSEELVKVNRVTEASEFLRDSAREILDGQQKLKEQLDAMHEIIQKLLRMERFIEEYSHGMNENVQKIMDYIIGICTDNEVVSWLEALPDHNEFVNLLRFFQKSLSPNPEDLSTPGGGHIDIVFVAHGRIDDRFMPSRGLVPAPNIRDTILYSPWNCAIDANAAFAIAQGTIHVSDRVFYNTLCCEPDPLPNHWNSMRRSLHDIPVILLSPLTPEDEAWDLFYKLMQNRSLKLGDRVIIPYLVPKDQEKAFGEIPLYILIFATSFILSVCDRTATVHLAACLSREESYSEEWQRQYAYTSDAMHMSVNLRNVNMDSESFRAFRSLFDRNRR